MQEKGRTTTARTFGSAKLFAQIFQEDLRRTEQRLHQRWRWTLLRNHAAFVGAASEFDKPSLCKQKSFRQNRASHGVEK